MRRRAGPDRERPSEGFDDAALAAVEVTGAGLTTAGGV